MKDDHLEEESKPVSVQYSFPKDLEGDSIL